MGPPMHSDQQRTKPIVMPPRIISPIMSSASIYSRSPRKTPFPHSTTTSRHGDCNGMPKQKSSRKRKAPLPWNAQGKPTNKPCEKPSLPPRRKHAPRPRS